MQKTGVNQSDYVFLLRIMMYLPCISLHKDGHVLCVSRRAKNANNFSIILHNVQHFPRDSSVAISEQRYQKGYIVYQFYVWSNLVDASR